MQNKLDKLLLLLEDKSREEWAFTYNNPYCKQSDRFVKEREKIRNEIHKMFNELECLLTMNTVK